MEPAELEQEARGMAKPEPAPPRSRGSWPKKRKAEAASCLIRVAPWLAAMLVFLEAGSLVVLATVCVHFDEAAITEILRRGVSTNDSTLVAWVRKYEIKLSPQLVTSSLYAWARRRFPRGEAQIWFVLQRFITTSIARSQTTLTVRNLLEKLIPLCVTGFVPPAHVRPLLLATLDSLLAGDIIAGLRSSSEVVEHPLDCALLDRSDYFTRCDFVHDDDYADEARVVPTLENLAKFLVTWSLLQRGARR